MPSRLPDSLQMSAPRGQRPPMQEGPDAIAAGINTAVESLGVAFAKKADDEASDALTTFQTDFQTRAAERAAAYDGSKPGFAQEEAARFDSELAAFEQTHVRRSARGAFQTRSQQAKAGYVGRAIAVESQARAGVVAERQEGLDRQALAGTQQAYQAAASADLKPLYDTLDPSDTGFVDKVMTARTSIIDSIRPNVPQRLQSRFDTWAAAGAVEEQARALGAREQGQEKALLLGATGIVRQAGNQVLGDPDLYETARKQSLDAIVALPDDVEAALRPRIENDLAVSRVKGLVSAGRDGEAVRLLESGALDKVVEDKDGLLKYARNGGRSEMQQFLAAQDVRSRMEAARDDAATGGAGDQVSLDEISRTLGPGAAAEFGSDMRVAKAVGGQTVALPEQSVDEVRALATAQPPDPDDPDYAVKKKAWAYGAASAQQELKAREKDGAAWAFRSSSPTDTGAVLERRAVAIEAAPTGKARADAARSFSNMMIWRQEASGAPMASWRLQTEAQAKAKAAAVLNAKPEARAGELAKLGGYVQAFPAAAKDNSGRAFSPRAMVIGELVKDGGLLPAYQAALTDFGDDHGPGGVLERFAGALNVGPQAVKLEDAKAEKALGEAVTREMGDYIRSTAPLDRGKTGESREMLVRMMARKLVVQDGLSPDKAARQAAGAYNGQYLFRGDVRVPKEEQANAERIASGLGVLKREVTKGDGAFLLHPGQKGATSSKQGVFTADAVQRFGRWTTRADDSGVVLMMPNPDGIWTAVQDRWGRPVGASWDQAGQAWFGRSETGGVGQASGGFDALKPPATPPKGDKLAAPVAARPAVFEALVGAVTQQETGSNPRQVSPKGAVGGMQLMPDTARAAAGRLGIRYDESRLLNDHPYNARLGREELRFLLDKYRHPALALAAYNAGPGNVDKWLRRFGDPRSGAITVDSWVSQLPFAETKNYVQQVLPRAYSRLTQ